jgi:hypothetical protein
VRFLIFFLVLVLAGCETTKLWTENADRDFIKVVPTTPDEDVEVALEASGREHYCENLYDSSHPNNKICYTKFTAEDKAKEIQVKLFKTPEALVTDAGHSIVVVGSAALNIIMASGYYKGQEKGRPRPT